MPTATLTISLDENGNMSVNGPIDNLPLCYSMMELAKDSLRERAQKKRQQIQPPQLNEVLAFGKK